MSKIGKIPVEIKQGVTAQLTDRNITVSGANGTFTYLLPQGVQAQINDGKIMVKLEKEETGNRKNKNLNALFGLTRAKIANMVKGVSQGFEKKLNLTGVGYRASVSGNDLVLSVGFSHPVKIAGATGIKFAVSENVITVSGSDKTLVGDIADRIQRVRPPDPYKGKGISYVGQRLRKKAGKAKAAGAK